MTIKLTMMKYASSSDEEMEMNFDLMTPSSHACTHTNLTH